MLNKIKFTLIIFVCIVSVLLFNDTYRILATQVYNENFSILDDRYFSENNVDIRNIDKNNPIGIASIFHIFSKDTYISADCNGNIASENCDILEYGTRTNNFNLTSGADVFYIKNVKEVRNSTSFRGAKNHVIFGSKVQGDFSDKGLQINNQNVNSKNIQSLVFNNDKYIDFDNEFMKLANKSEQYYSHLEDSNDFKKSFSDMNRRTIEFENTDSTKTKYLNVPYEYISCPQDIFLKNISQNANVIINVTDIPNSSELSINTKTQLNYRGSYGNLNSSENHSLPNKILWNFGNYSGSIHFSSGFFYGKYFSSQCQN
ncbi:choice-of-anchor A family protein [Apilactobacillus ozensis]|uniref:choice-of-anchor A family protein n=1 Tax=Apilactobacillus ozensis TaxID=866801 RepID=UPI0006D13AA8|nr:choice-of-anchor A family protein [Apilactobacillus ozensis]